MNQHNQEEMDLSAIVNIMEDVEGSKPADESIRGDLRIMLNACGGQEDPNEELVDKLEECLKSYVGYVLQYAMSIGRNGRLSLEAIYYIVRRDPVKFERIRELLSNQDKLKNSKKMLKEPHGP